MAMYAAAAPVGSRRFARSTPDAQFRPTARVWVAWTDAVTRTAPSAAPHGEPHRVATSLFTPIPSMDA